MEKRGKPRRPRKPPKDGGSPKAAKPDDSFPLHEHLGRHLKALFDDVANEPIPDKLIDLLDELEGKPPRTGKAR